MTEAEWLGNDEDEDGFVGVGLVVSETGGLALMVADTDDWHLFRIDDVEARNLAAMIDAVLA